MAVSREDVAKIAELARLHPDEGAIERLTGELNGILEHVRVLGEVDVSEVDEDRWTLSEVEPFRDPGLPRDELAPGAPGDRAPQWRDGFFLVPRLPALDGGDPSEEEGGA